MEPYALGRLDHGQERGWVGQGMGEGSLGEK
jgi:hypothetical protein